jgi:hypothetical protein
MMNLNIQLSGPDVPTKTIHEKKENTTFKRLISQCLNKREIGSFNSIPASNLKYTVKQMWENPTFKFLRKLGIEKYLDQVIYKGATLCPEGIVIINKALRSPLGISERVRLKVMGRNFFLKLFFIIFGFCEF